jgi:hypothetical protein
VCEIINRCLFILCAHGSIGVCSYSIYKYLPTRFEFRPQLTTVTFLFLLNPQIAETSAAAGDNERHDLLTTDINYTNLDDSTDQDDFFLMHPMDRHLFSRLTCPLLSAFL